MRFLPFITILMWVAIVTSYFYARSFLFQPQVVIPAFTLLSTFVPVCFWTLQLEKRRIFSLVFIGIFMANGVALSYKFVDFINRFSSIEPYRSLVLDPDQVKLAISGKNEQSRINMSRNIYEKSGVITAYKNNDGELTIYTPTDLDKSVMLSNFNNHYNFLESKEWLKYYSLGILLLIMIQIITFVGILTYLILHEGPGSRKPIKSY